ncbi:MAG: hypothetical protein IJB96_01285 [Lachnospira sp.]|nr:hypothetical protein [Lachnospira sp.]
MFCTKCGYNLGDANFCPQCGNPAKKPVVTPVQEMVVAEPVVVTPAIEPVVTPVVESVVAPVVESVVAPVVESVVTPVVESVVAPVSEAVEEAVAPVAETVEEKVSSVAESVEEAVVAPVAEPIAETVEEAVEVVKEAEPVSEVVEEAVAPVAEAVEETVASAVETVEETVAPVAEVVEETVAPVVEAVEEKIVPAAETVEEAVEVVKEAEPVSEVVEEAVTPVAEAVEETVASAVETVEETAAPVAEVVEETVAPVVEAVEEKIVPAAETVEPVMEQIPVAVPTAEPIIEKVEAVASQPEQVAQQAVASQPVQVAQQAVASQPVQATQNPNLTWNNEAQQMWNTYQPTSKKKSKAPIIIGVVAALVIALVCVGIFVVMPMIKEKKRQEEIAKVNLAGTTALKSVTAEIKASASSFANNLVVVKSGSKQKATSSFTLNKLVTDDEDVLSYFNVDTVNYTVEADAETGKTNLTIGLSKGASAPVLNMYMYTDGSTAYIRIPELFSGSLKAPVEVEEDTEDDDDSDKTEQIIKILSNMDEETMKQYAKVFETVVAHIVTGLDSVIDKAQYTKNDGTVTLSAGELGSDAYESYNVVVNKSDVIAAYNSTINAIFDDASVVPYITMISTFVKRIDKETLKTEFADSLKDAPNTFKMTLYTKDSKFAGVGINEKDYDEKEEGVITVLAVGGKSLYVDWLDGAEYLKLTLDARNDIKKLTVNSDIEDSYMTINSEWKMSGTSCEITKFELINKDTKKDTGVSVSLTGKTSVEKISEVTFKESNFPNVIDTSTATQEQAMAYMSELAGNLQNLQKKLFSDKYLQGSGMMGTQPDGSGSTSVNGTAGSL